MGALEAQYAKFTGDLIEFSEQQLVDCDHENYGCDGGYMHLAFNYTINNNWLLPSQHYPYNAKRGFCNGFVNKNSPINLLSYGFVRYGDEEDLKYVLATNGPVSVAIDVSEYGNLMYYQEGIFTDATCSSMNLNHAVLLVGYGTDFIHGDYWIIKNSWGSNFGEKGYFRLKRNKNMCGIASMAVYPIAFRNTKYKFDF